MASILCVWEMGGGTGHLANLTPWVKEAVRRGHRVTLAVPNVDIAARWFAGHAIDIVPAPLSPQQRKPPAAQLLSFTQVLLHNLGAADELAPRVAGWQALFDRLQPDVVLYEFAPAALIASLGRPWQKWIIGNGFTLPRVDLPYFGLFPRVRNTEANTRALATAETQLVHWVNSVQTEALTHPAELYAQADEQLLMTLPDIDPFGERPTPSYLGVAAPEPGARPQWPERSGTRVFGYLQPFPGLPRLLQHLQHLGQSDACALIYCPGLPASASAAYPAINMTGRPLDLGQTFDQADLVITMASHTTSAQAFLAGTAQLLLPMGLEQFYTARRIVAAGRGIGARADQFEKGVLDQALALAARGRADINAKQRHALQGGNLGRKVTALFDALPL
ncbi:hypothetical protein FV139_05520 [Parahaliea maris]|uniref:UDP:flavonoid glycosyltransferase YjiC, YdhE family n=1 Tax=Parahaliea maris TaxID=2716870 RepID=A0A5C9A5N4_9GAMM|nr:hypothetical protein [Parahaliea maris]TXS95354.1 hypothetical protein FV139_05520 [Parahaliea maris]